ncbi:hypothetical protein LOAG_13248 [Loa loa]|uniref:Uncharacterized protein n=1 Tax=Loa loa TaxID=7209 RepID=A0A1S0TKT9_LOALO|nr:hypothetical protein LOAG_13248 [Loa loa]EFO15263.1 hypothetical protein LOAG_13248 [Loa loa]
MEEDEEEEEEEDKEATIFNLFIVMLLRSVSILNDLPLLFDCSRSSASSNHCNGMFMSKQIFVIDCLNRFFFPIDHNSLRNHLDRLKLLGSVGIVWTNWNCSDQLELFGPIGTAPISWNCSDQLGSKQIIFNNVLC